MKLYELPRNSYFTLNDDPDKEVFLLERIDGMYSSCYNSDEELIHLAAFTDVEFVKAKQ
jgi:hypothetical protein